MLYNQKNSISNEVKEKDITTRLACYCRISTTEQEKGFGLEAQLRMVKDHIKRNMDRKSRIFNEELDIYTDPGYSGSLESRPAFDKLKDKIIKGEINHIIVTDFDRLFRDVAHFLKFIDFLKKYKATLESIIQVGINVFTDEGRLQLTFMQGFSEYEKRKISMRTMAGKMEKCKQGYVINSNTKYGFSIERSGENGRNKKIIVNEEEAKIVKEIFNKFYYDGKTQCEIAKELTERRVPTRSDTDPKSKAKSRNGYGVWTQEKISDILRREESIGLSYYGKTKTEYGTSTLLPKEEWIPVNCPSIIEKELFYNVQKLLEAKINPTRKKNCNFYILSGLILCPICGMKYQGYRSGKGNHYYRCKGGKSRNLNIENPCTNKQVSGLLLENFVWGIIKEVIGNPARFSKNFEKMVQEKSKIENYEKEIEQIIEDIEKKKRELTSFIIMRSQSKSDETSEVYDNLIKTHEIVIKDLSNKKAELNHLIESELKNGDILDILSKLSKIFSKNISLIEKDKKSKEKLIKMIINKTIISTDILDVYLNFSKNNDYIKGVEVIDEKSNHLIKLTFKRDVINTYIYNKNKSVFEYLYNK